MIEVLMRLYNIKFSLSNRTFVLQSFEIILLRIFYCLSIRINLDVFIKGRVVRFRLY